MKNKKKTRLIYRNVQTGEKVEFRKPDAVTYVYDSPDGKKFLNRHQLNKDWEFVPDDSFIRSVRPIAR